MAKHTNEYYIKRIEKILGDHYYYFSWCTPEDRGVYLTSKHFTSGVRWFKESSYEKLYAYLKGLTTLDILKLKAMVIRRTYDNTYGYVNEKCDDVNKITLDCDAYIIWNMFDTHNQKKLLEHLTDKEIELIGINNINPLIV